MMRLLRVGEMRTLYSHNPTHITAYIYLPQEKIYTHPNAVAPGKHVAVVHPMKTIIASLPQTRGQIHPQK